MTQSNSSKKKKLSTSNINKTNDLKVNRGVELILNKPKKGGVTVIYRTYYNRYTSNSILTIFCWCCITGWLIRDYMMNYQEIPRPHPEMFDENGNLVPDDIVAFRFENYDSNEEDDD